MPSSEVGVPCTLHTVEDSDIRDELDSVVRFLVLHHPKVFGKYLKWKNERALSVLVDYIKNITLEEDNT
jgi:hypothetical protein